MEKDTIPVKQSYDHEKAFLVRTLNRERSILRGSMVNFFEAFNQIIGLLKTIRIPSTDHAPNVFKMDYLLQWLKREKDLMHDAIKSSSACFQFVMDCFDEADMIENPNPTLDERLRADEIENPNPTLDERLRADDA